MSLLELEDGWDLGDGSAPEAADAGSAAEAVSFTADVLEQAQADPQPEPEPVLEAQPDPQPEPEPVLEAQPDPQPEPAVEAPPQRLTEVELPPPTFGEPEPAPPSADAGLFARVTTKLGPFGALADATAPDTGPFAAPAKASANPFAGSGSEQDGPFAQPAADFVTAEEAQGKQSHPLPFGDPTDTGGSADSVELSPGELPLPPVETSGAMARSPFGDDLAEGAPESDGVWGGPAEDSAELALPTQLADEMPQSAIQTQPDLQTLPAGTELSIGADAGGIDVNMNFGAVGDAAAAGGVEIDIDVDFGAPAEPGSAMDLVESAQTAGGDADAMLRRARELHELGDFSGSLAVVEKVLAADANNAEALSYLQRNEGTLLSMYESKLGALTNVPVVAISEEEVMWLNLNHRAGFILSQIDGMLSYEEILDLSAMPRLETCRIFVDLIREGVIRNRAV